jgi:RNA polymerase sigma-70 factor (ECF subfamily)
MSNWTQQAARPTRFEQLALPHLDGLHYAALRLTRDPSEADDLVQETYLRAYRAFHQLTQEESCRAWLMKIMTNIWLNRLPKRAHESTALDIDAIEASVDDGAPWHVHGSIEEPEAAVMRKRFCEDIEEALQRLPQAFRIVVILVDVEGLSYKEVAETLKCPVGTVMSRLHRGRKLLQKTLWVYARGNQDCSSPFP